MANFAIWNTLACVLFVSFVHSTHSKEHISEGELIARSLYNTDQDLEVVLRQKRDSDDKPAKKAKAKPVKQPPKLPKSNFVPTIPLKQANKEFLECCNELKMKKSCLPICNYNVGAWKLASTLFMTNCGVMTINSWLSCANGGDRGSNNTECCRSHNVLDGGGKICNSFCEQYPSVKPEAGIWVCAARLKNILKCHHAGLKPKPKEEEMSK